MALKFKLKSKDEAPVELQNLYVEREGAWLLDVEGVVDSGRLSEFRQTNIRQAKELEDLRAAYSGMDPGAVREMLDDEQKDSQVWP
jgi:hypothetical protein